MKTSPNVPEQVPGGPDQADLFDYAAIRAWAGFVLRAPMRNRALAAGSFLAVLVASVIALQVLPRRYQVQAVVLAQRSPIMGSLSNPGLNREWDAPTRAAREVVLRRDNLIALCRQTDFVNRYVAGRAPVVRVRDWLRKVLGMKVRTRDEMLQDILDTLETRLWVSAGAEGTVTLTFEWSDRNLAYDVVDAALQSFLEARHASEISMVGETVAILESHAARVQKEIADTVPRLEERERRLRSTAGPRRPIVRARPRDEELVRLDSFLSAQRRALSDLEEFRQRRVAELQAQLAQSLTQYAPEHPAVVSTRKSIDNLSAPSTQIETLRNDIKGLERDITRRGGVVLPTGPTLPEAFADVRAAFAEEDPRSEYERDQLRLLFRQYASLTDRLDSARVELDTAQAAFKHRYSVVTPPQLPKRPMRPNPPLVLLGALVGGIAFAFFAAAARDLWSGKIVEGWQIERRFEIPLLAEIDE